MAGKSGCKSQVASCKLQAASKSSLHVAFAFAFA